MNRIPVIEEVRLTLPCGHWRTVSGSLPIRDWDRVQCFGCLLGIPVSDGLEEELDLERAAASEYGRQADLAWDRRQYGLSLKLRREATLAWEHVRKLEEERG
jgi:hypothetical protein